MDLVPAPFADLVARVLREPEAQGTLFDLGERNWHLSVAEGLDLSVDFHGQRAGNAVGPAAGPHTQMAQNLVLSYIAGSRILELKTVQVNDRLAIGRPCIDMTNVGYNIEWSQELLVEDSIREYVAGWMLIEMLRRARPEPPAAWQGAAGDFIFDLSVGYDLEGIKSPKVQAFLDAMRDAGVWIEKLRADIPARFGAARDLEYPRLLSNSVTLSTFHGCPAGEIERICEFLIGERGLDVIVKMNPPMLGKERLEHLLHDVLGYAELTVNPSAYTSGLLFDEALGLVDRLGGFAKARGRRLGCKFSNTLEVINHRSFFTPDNKVMYLSGQPLHVITLALTDVFRQAVGPRVPISFSAGIDKLNFPSAVACGFVPVTTSTDLLRQSGYGRLPAYLTNLEAAMKACGASNIDAYILNAFGKAEEARRLAREKGEGSEREAIEWAGLLNTTEAARAAEADPRYRADRNRGVPKRIESKLVIFDCITCDKCIPVCPNDANFTYPLPQARIEFADVMLAPGGEVRRGEPRAIVLEKKRQIANYADFCNECGNCDTFCPEYGGPYIEKPSFYGSRESYAKSAPRDGFFVAIGGSDLGIVGRIKGREYRLSIDAAGGAHRFSDGAAEAILNAEDGTLIEARPLAPLTGEHALDLGVYHTLRLLRLGALDASRMNQVNAALFT